MESVVLAKFRCHPFNTKKEWSETNYSFFTDMTDLKPNDIVVCDSQYGPSICKVERYAENSIERYNAETWVIQKVDFEAHKKRLENMRRKEEIWQQFENIKSEYQTLEIIKLLSKDNEKLQKLLKDYQELS